MRRAADRPSALSGRGEVRFHRVQVAREHRGLHGLETLLELVDAQASRGGVRGQAIGGVGALAVADPHELRARAHASPTPCAAARRATASSVHGPALMTAAWSMPSAASPAHRVANSSGDSPGLSRVLTVFSISS